MLESSRLLADRDLDELIASISLKRRRQDGEVLAEVGHLVLILSVPDQLLLHPSHFVSYVVAIAIFEEVLMAWRHVVFLTSELQLLIDRHLLVWASVLR